MTCCSGQECAGANKFFSKFSAKYARRFRKKGLERVQTRLLEGIKRIPIPSAEILDIGCGVGALHITLLRDGAAHATGVDAATGMIRQAGTFARELGVFEKVEYVLGDFTKVVNDIRPADITILDKVVCCYENAGELVGKSLEKTRRVYAVSMPRENAFVRYGFLVEILFAKLFKAAFYPYWHNWEDLRTLIVSRGFKPIYEARTLLWSIAVFERG